MSCIPRHSIDSELSVYESIFSLYRKKKVVQKELRKLKKTYK